MNKILNILVNTKIKIANITKLIIENPLKTDCWKIIVPPHAQSKIIKTFARFSIGFNKTIFPDFSVFVFSIKEYETVNTSKENIINPAKAK